MRVDTIKKFFVSRDLLHSSSIQGKIIFPMVFSLATVFVLFYASLIPTGASLTEVDYYYSASSLSEIVSNPLSLPYKLVASALVEISPSVRSMRALSVIVFSLSIFALFKILHRWHSQKIAMFATALFATNATVLAIARLGTPLVLLFSWSIILSILLWLQYGKSRKVAPVSLALVGALLFYIPGAPYFFLLLLVLFGNRYKTIFRSSSRNTLLICVFFALLVVAPLFYSMIQNVAVLREWLLIPNSIVWGDIPKNILRVPSAFIYRAPVNPLINVGRLPILDVASGGLFLLGLFSYYKNYKLERVRIMVLSALFAILLGALGQVTAGFILMIPFAYAVIAAGISLLLDEWYKVFPQNPFARSFGLLAVVVMLSFSVYYQLNRFLIVWPQTPETRQEYNQSRILSEN